MTALVSVDSCANARRRAAERLHVYIHPELTATVPHTTDLRRFCCDVFKEITAWWRRVDREVVYSTEFDDRGADLSGLWMLADTCGKFTPY